MCVETYLSSKVVVSARGRRRLEDGKLLSNKSNKNCKSRDSNAKKCTNKDSRDDNKYKG